MADFLTAYSITQSAKLAVIDDRPDGTVTTMTYGQLNEQANRLANLLLDLDARPGDTKVAHHGVTGFQEDVLRLDVPVNDPVGMGVSQGVRDLGVVDKYWPFDQ